VTEDDDDHDHEDDQQTSNSRRSKPKYSRFDILPNTNRPRPRGRPSSSISSAQARVASSVHALLAAETPLQHGSVIEFYSFALNRLELRVTHLPKHERKQICQATNLLVACVSYSVAALIAGDRK
jgi:hypothetical protein